MCTKLITRRDRKQLLRHTSGSVFRNSGSPPACGTLLLLWACKQGKLTSKLVSSSLQQENREIFHV
jgi:hypothetical protein